MSDIDSGPDEEAEIYSERYVAFVDILGFSNIVRQSSSDREKARKLAKALESIPGSLSPQQVIEADIRTTTFSDCIVVSAAPIGPGLTFLLAVLGDLSYRLLQIGVMVRGGVAKGAIHHSDKAVFGPAFLDAYALENSVANFPRVVVSRTVYDDYMRYKDLFKFTPGLQDAEDGPAFIDFLAIFTMNETAQHLFTTIRSKCRAELQSLLNEARFNPHHFVKVKWLAIYWNTRVALPLSDEEVWFP